MVEWILDTETKNENKAWLIPTLVSITAMDFRRVDNSTHITFHTTNKKYTIAKGYEFMVDRLQKGDIIICHNLAYDIGTFVKLFNFDPFPWVTQFRDTLVISQMVFQKTRLAKEFPKYPINYSLDLWGKRLGKKEKIHFEGDYGVDTAKLREYLHRDTYVTRELYLFLKTQKNYPNKTNIVLENYSILISILYQVHGWKIDTEKLNFLYQKYYMKVKNLDIQLADKFLPLWKVNNTRKVTKKKQTIKYRKRYKQSYIIPISKAEQRLRLKWTKKFIKTLSTYPERSVTVEYHPPYTNIELEYFKPSSRQSIIKAFKKRFGTKFLILSKTKNPKLDKDILKDISEKSSGSEKELLNLLAKRFESTKKLQQVETIQKVMLNGRVYPTLSPTGATATGRSSSSRPNFQNIDNAKEFRDLFIPDEGYKMIDSDLSSAELVLLAHLLYPYDNGKMVDMLLKGDKHKKTDFHSKNAINMGISRNKAKQAVYGYFYGVGSLKMGINFWDNELYDTFDDEEITDVKDKLYYRVHIINDLEYFPLDNSTWIPWDNGDLLARQYIFGEQLKRGINQGIEGLMDLLNDLDQEVEDTDYLANKILCKRKIYAKGATSPLNYTLQPSNAILTKIWHMLLVKVYLDKGFKINKDFLPLGVIHDQIVFQAKGEALDIASDILDKLLEYITKILKLNIPITCETEIVDALTGHG